MASMKPISEKLVDLQLEVTDLVLRTAQDVSRYVEP